MLHVTMKEGKYNIKAICTMLGIQPGTLRAWERRYHIVSPVRNEAGHRLYTEEHAKILKWLLEKTQEGFTIGQAVALLESNQHVQEEGEENIATELVNHLTNALLAFDEEKATKCVNEAFCLFSIEKIMSDVFAAVLGKIKQLWEEGAITAAHEHFAGSYLRMRMGMIYQHLSTNPALPKVITVCGPNEERELGLFLFTIFLRRKGYQVIYLGSGIGENDLKIVIEQMNPKLLFLSCSYLENIEGTQQLAGRLEQNYPDLLVGLQGEAFVNNASVVDNRYVGYRNEEWEEWLHRKLS